MSAWNVERVLSVRHWTDSLFSFTLTRDQSFRFRSGQFTMIGLRVDGKPLLRAYSMVSAAWEDTLEFLSIKVQNGPLTSRLRHIEQGAEILVGRKPVGTLLPDNLLPGRNLYLLGTGTGLAPFMSLIRDPDVYERFERVVLVHGCRFVGELAYGAMIEQLPADAFLGPLVANQLIYYPTVTREPFRNQGRISTLVESGKLASDVGLPPLDPASDRVMLCGSPGLLADMTRYLDRNGFQEGSNAAMGAYVIEKAFVEK
ncbi:MAG: ferredoxin--NADP reductase [Rhodopila sp.]|nr:ferredoxin--NADP reductase [Rhodopila sp.]